MPETIVLQSHRRPLPQPWLEHCLQSVTSWAGKNGYGYEFIGDELFDAVPPQLLEKTKQQKVIASDLARLFALQRLLNAGYKTVVWCDADFLIFSPNQFVLPETKYALGREVWIQTDNKNKLRVYTKVHNAFLMFRQGNNFLDFYTETAQKLIDTNRGSMPPQYIGPKLLTSLHNIVQCPVMETAGMLSPLVIEDIIQGNGGALSLFNDHSPQSIKGANLCCSSIQRGELTGHQMDKVINILINSSGLD